MHALFILAHQDDEIAMASRIAHCLRSGWKVTCAYLTNGEGRRAPSHVRDAESREVLKRLGVTSVHMLGSEEGIPDGQLVDHLGRAWSLLEARITEAVDEVYCLAWEGGHQDHDASHLVAVAFAAKRGVDAFELPLYHGHGVPGPFFRVLSPIGEGWSARAIAFTEALKIVSLCRFYRSQRKTWLGLLPEAVVRLAFARKEWTRRVDPARAYGRPPHAGKLYYERRFGVTWEEFEARARTFVAALAPAPRPAADRR
jgi:LmbE family N-acetylglucosaminyl deacetylase